MRWPVRPPRPAPPEWRRVFALVPHLCGDTWVWLEPVERKVWVRGPKYVVYTYRLPQ